jgi:hypothetical protein
MRSSTARVLLLLAVACPPAAAHRDDYLDETFVYRTVARRVTIFENWFDLRHPRGEDRFFRHSIGVEHGVSDHFMLNGLVAFDNGVDGYSFRRWRFEGRYRFGEEKPHGISPAVSLEYEDDRLEQRRTLSPRLVLNRDFKEFNITLNGLREIELTGNEGSAWGYAAGLRYGERKRLRYGAELKQTFGRQTRGLLIPQMWFRLLERLELKVGYGQRITHAGDSFFRAVLELELGKKD